MMIYIYKYDDIYIGAIPFVRSNVPPILMAWETDNHAYGSTLNPWNKDRVAGGSSGGEAVLISSRSSPLGIGTDIGGSVRIPASICGIYSLKPTTGRCSTQDVGCQEVPGQMAILSSPGPMGRSVADLELVMKVWGSIPTASSEAEEMGRMWEIDPYTPPSPWRTYTPSKKKPLRIGVIRTNTFFTPAVTCLRALDESIAVLRRAGVEVIEWTPPCDLLNAALLANKVFTADSCDWLSGVLGDEWPHATVLGGLIFGSLPSMTMGHIGALLQCFGVTRRIGLLASHTFGRRTGSVTDVWKLNTEVQEIQQVFTRQFQADRLDGILCPTVGLPAVQHGRTIDLLPVVTYTSLFNVLKWPAGNVPVTYVQESECHYTPKDQWVNDIMTKVANTQMKGALGLPVGVQIAALPYQDELVLHIMSILEEAFPFKPSI